jgi:F420-dependent oxidoreductase-like protein
MRFGIFVPQGWRLDLTGIDPAEHWPTMLRLAKRAEAGPWESIWVYDHFHTVPLPTDEVTYEAWTLMAAFAAATDTIRLGQMCTCMSYRQPTYLAKVAASIDVISGGRLEMGIGAGWYEHEWRAYGYGFPSAGDRIGRLDEGVQIMQQMWTQGSATLQGKHFQVDGAIGSPRPAQPGGVPLWIAGGGERKTLLIAAKYAAYTNFDSAPEGFQHKSEVLAAHCRDVGRDFEEITRSANYNVVIGATEKDVQDRVGWLRAHYEPLVPPAQVQSNMGNFTDSLLFGTPEQLVERLTRMAGLGLGYTITNFPEAAYDPSGMELFEREVIPALQA